MRQVKMKVAAVPNLRPIAIGYYSHVRDPDKDYSVVSHAKSVRNAARAAFTRILDRRAYKALIHAENGVVVARIWRERNKIHSVGM